MRPLVDVADPERLAARIADQLEASVQILRQQPLCGADVVRVGRQLEAEAVLCNVVRRALERRER